MGNGASHKARGVLYIKYNNKVSPHHLAGRPDTSTWHLLHLEPPPPGTSTWHLHLLQVQRVEYDRGSSCRDLEEQLAVAVGLSRSASFEERKKKKRKETATKLFDFSLFSAQVV